MKKGSVVVLLLLVTAMVSQAVELKWNGDVEYRLRYTQSKSIDDKGEKGDPLGNFTHQWRGNLKLKATANENLSFGVRVSNEIGYYTETVTDNVTTVNKDNAIKLSFAELYAKWHVGILDFSVGVIPVKASTLLDFVVYENVGYKGALAAGWIDYYNNSQRGMSGYFQFVDKSSFNMGLNTVWAVGIDGGSTKPEHMFKSDQYRFIFEVPMKINEGMFSLKPAAYLRTNMFTSSDYKKGNHSFAGGMDVKFAPVKAFSLNVGVVGGAWSNDSQKEDSVDTDGDGTMDALTTVTNPSGLGLATTAVVKPGFGKLKVKFVFNNHKDNELKEVVNHRNTLVDVRYYMPVKNFTIQPRFRVWNSMNDKDDSGKVKVRPELIFSGKF